MVTPRLKMPMLLVGIVILTAIIVYQQTRIDRFRTESAMLRQQLQEQVSLLDERERQGKPQPSDEMRSNSVTALPEEQFRELLRLRGEVGVLKGQLAGQLTHYQSSLQELTGKYEVRLAEKQFNAASLMIISKGSLEALASALKVPETVSKMKAREGLSDERMKQYWPYFQFKASYETMQKILGPPDGDQAEATVPAPASNQIVGVGMALSKGDENGSPKITGVVPASPAAQAGIEAGWSVLTIDGINTAGRSLNDCVSLVRGDEGTTVALELADPASGSTKRVTLTRLKILIPAPASKGDTP